MQGDLLLFKTDGSLGAWLVTIFSKGPFVHVAIDMGDNTEIAAHPKGVSRQPIFLNKGEMVRIPIGAKASPECLYEAMNWLKSQQGKPYGWVDIIDYGLGVLGLPIKFFEKNHHDCSTLASLFINRLCIPNTYLDDPDTISPNDLARFFGVL